MDKRLDLSNLPSLLNATKDIESEKTVLGSMLIEKAAIIKVSGVLSEADFYEPLHKMIYRNAIKMFEEGKPVEVISLHSYMKENGIQIPIQTLFALIDIVATAANVEYYAHNVKTKAIKRKLSDMLIEKVEGLKNGKDSLQTMNEISEQVKLLTLETEPEQLNFDARLLQHELMDELEARAKRFIAGEKVTGLRTDFTHFDNLVNGLQSGLYILGAPPSVGKTTFCRQLADHVARANKIPVIFVSYEQSRFELMLKSISRVTHLDSFKLQKGNVADEWSNITAKIGSYYIECAPYIVTLEGDTTTYVDKIKLHCLRAMDQKKKNKCLIIIDYLQIVPTREPFRDKRTQVDKVLSDLRRLARELNSPVWAVSSFARESYKEGKQKPSIASFKESGGIEYTADLAILMETEKGEDYKKDSRTIYFRICKNRNGATGKIVFVFTPKYSEFQERAREDLEQEYML